MDSLELIVDRGRPANAGRFFQLGTDLLSLLDELTEVPVAWSIEDLRTGSAVARIAPPPSNPEDGRWLGLAVESLDEVAVGNSLPNGWTPDAVKMAHRFVDHAQPVEDEADWSPPQLRLVRDAEDTPTTVDLNADLSDKLAGIQPFERRMPGAVRGTLVGLSVSRGNRASLRVRRSRVVRVAFDSSMKGELKDALYQNVELRGQIRQDGEGQIFHVKADEVQLLGETKSSWSELFGIDPNFTDGASIDDWLGAHRGEA